MLDIEQFISPFIESQFPAFYKDEGSAFVLFVKAYYEWLEENHQLLELEDTTDFNVGDTIQQADVQGTVIAYVGADILVLVKGVDTFKCFNVCNELIPVTSSSGGTTYIKKGGTTRRLGALFFARNLPALRDIDTTLDTFIIHFKEKYLKNIEFDVATNKRLLVKNSLDMFRSKGTERSIDLFFRLIYGVSAQVYYPGDDLFRLSDGEWYEPQYLEITSNPDRAIDLVGKQITGATSSATAFVERYVRRRIKDGFVDILYLSNVQGQFVNREILKHNTIYSDSPTVVGSLTSVEIITGGRLFEVGDIVSFNSVKGDYGLARVSATEDNTGIVDFLFVDGGWGYTTSADTDFTASELRKRSQSIVSEKVLTLSNVVTTNSVSLIKVNSGGTGYNNTNIAVVNSAVVNAYGDIITNGSGVIQSIVVSAPGTGFITSNASVLITNSIGGSTGVGTSASLEAITKRPSEYFSFFESFVQRRADVDYINASNNELFAAGDLVRFTNTVSGANSGFAIVIENANNDLALATGTLSVAIVNGSITSTNSIFLVSNSSINAVSKTVTDTSAVGKVMGKPNTAILTVSSLTGGIPVRDDVVYQLDSAGVETGRANIFTTSVNGSDGSFEVHELSGVFLPNAILNVRDKNITATLTRVSLPVGLYSIQNSFTKDFEFIAQGNTNGTTGNVTSISTGSGASFRIGSISETEQVTLDTDLLNANNTPPVGANVPFMSVPLSSTAYGFPNNPTGNSGSIIFSCLTFDQLTIGSIASLTSINPGTQYNVDPFVLVRQPFVSGYGYNDYIIRVANASGIFYTNEKILQTNTQSTFYDLIVENETGFRVGETVYQTTPAGPANAVIYAITPTTNTITVKSVTGAFANSTGSYGNLISRLSNSTIIQYNTGTNIDQFTNGVSISIGTTVRFAGNTTSVIEGNSTSKGFIVTNGNTGLFVNNDVVLYAAASGNSVIGGLANSIYRYVKVVNATAIQLSEEFNGPAINISSVSNSSYQVHQLIKLNASADVIYTSNSSTTAGNLYVRMTSGSPGVGNSIYLYTNSTPNLDVKGSITAASVNILGTKINNVELQEVISTAKGIVKTTNSTAMTVKRIQLDNLFTVGQTITGQTSQATATIVSVDEDETTLPIGLNAQISGNVVTANGSITQLQIIDSGIGYANGEIMLFSSEDGTKSGEAKAIIAGKGTGSGYYKTSRGFLSSISKIHDGDYYQEYSYEVMSRVPLERYADMFRKVMHTAGTRFFGSLQLSDTLSLPIQASNTSVEIQLSDIAQFNSNSNVSANAIFIDNDYANGNIIFANSAKVTYYTLSGNSVIFPLINNHNYYIYGANSTSFKLTTNPRLLSYSFNPNTQFIYSKAFNANSSLYEATFNSNSAIAEAQFNSNSAIIETQINANSSLYEASFNANSALLELSFNGNSSIYKATFEGANSSIVNTSTGFIKITNCQFIDGDIVTYRAVNPTGAAPTLVSPLTNESKYYAKSSNSTGTFLANSSGGSAIVLSLASSPTTVHTITSNFIKIATNTLGNNEVVTYRTNTSVSTVNGLANNRVYYAYLSNSTGTYLASNSTGAVVSIEPTVNSASHYLRSNFFRIASHQFSDGEVVTYNVSAGNTNILPLQSDMNYYINSSNSTGFYVKRYATGNVVTMTAKGLNESGHRFRSNFIRIASNPITNNMIVTYEVLNGNTSLTNLANSVQYYAKLANSTGTYLSPTRNGDFIQLKKGLTENGHYIRSHFITIANNPIANNTLVTYLALNGNTVIPGLANNTQYYAKMANSSGTYLSTVPGGTTIRIKKGLTETGHYLESDFIVLSGHTFSNSEIVTYIVDGGNSAISGLVNATSYYIRKANTTGVYLSNEPGGDIITIRKGLTQTGHRLRSSFIEIPDHNFKNGEVVSYTAINGNTAISGLTNSASYGIINANTSGVYLTTNATTTNIITIAKGLTESGHYLQSSFIKMARHNFNVDDVIKYTTNSSVSSVSGLSNNSTYHVIFANSSGIKLSASPRGTQLPVRGNAATGNGYTMSIAVINIQANSTQSGTKTAGQYITRTNEI